MSQRQLTDEEPEERSDLLTVVSDDDYTHHLRKWSRYDGTDWTVAWCDREFETEENDVWTFPMGLLDYESLCLDCYYAKRTATKEMFERSGIE